ncbi:ABC transporter [Entamoeba marina]
MNEENEENEDHVAFDVIPSDSHLFPANVTFKNIKIELSLFSRTSKLILDDVNGYVMPGELVALMGLSGAGKSTLLDILSGIRKSGMIFGRYAIGYVSQANYLMKTQTVREALMFYATLKSPPFTRRKVRKVIVEDVMETLNLKHIEDEMIGDETKRGISGGEKKRVSIGCELVTNPSVLFLDEPTTGLDSFGCLSVVDLLHKIAKTGTTILCTIHQPRELAFEKFDKILMLSNGRVMYFGKPSDCPAYLVNAGFHTEDNIADAMIDALTFETGSDQAKKYLMENFGGAEKHTLETAYKRRKPHIKEEIDEIVGVDVEEIRVPYRSHRGFIELSKRIIRNDWRIPSVIVGQLFVRIFFALLFGSIFFNIDNNQAGARMTTGILYFTTVITAMMISDFMVSYILDRPLMRRETNKRLYSITSYYVATVLHVTILLIFYSIVSASIIYPMIGLRSGFIHFFVFLVTIILVACVAQAFFFLIGSLSPNVVVAQILLPLFLIVLMIFTGFFIKKNDIPPYWIWAYYLSFFRYTFNILTINQFAGTTLYCSEGEYVNGVCPITTGDAYLISLDINPGMLVDFFVLIGFYVIFQTLAYVSVHIFWKEKR